MIGAFSKNNELFVKDTWHYAFIPDDTTVIQSARLLYNGKMVWNAPIKEGGFEADWSKNTTETPLVPLILKHGKIDKYKNAAKAQVWFDYDNKQWFWYDGLPSSLQAVQTILKQHKIGVTQTKLKLLMEKSAEEIFQQILEWHVLADKYKQKNPQKSNSQLWQAFYGEPLTPIPSHNTAQDSFGFLDEVTPASDQASFDQTYNGIKKMSIKKNPPPAQVYSWILRGGEVVRPKPVQDPEVPF